MSKSTIESYVLPDPNSLIDRDRIIKIYIVNSFCITYAMLTHLLLNDFKMQPKDKRYPQESLSNSQFSAIS